MKKKLTNLGLQFSNIVDGMGTNIPMQPTLQLNVENKIQNNKLPYRGLVGCLMYFILISTTSLSFCISACFKIIILKIIKET